MICVLVQCIAVLYVSHHLFEISSYTPYGRPIQYTLGLDQVAFLAIIFSHGRQINGLLFHRFFLLHKIHRFFFKSIMFHKSQKSLSKECNLYRKDFILLPLALCGCITEKNRTSIQRGFKKE